MTLALVSVELDYNVYEDADGDEIIGTPLPVVTPLTLWEDFDLAEAWANAVTDHRQSGHLCWSKPSRIDFIDQVRRVIADLDNMPEIVWCESCEDPTDEGAATSLANGNHACDECFSDNYSSCDDCSDVFHHDYLTSTLGDCSVCDSCRDCRYSYCEDCDGYFHDSDEREHRHGGCNCAPPDLSVRFPQSDGTTLSEDERATVSLPSGVISQEGMNSIARLIRDHSLEAVACDERGNMTKEGYELHNKWWNLSFDVAAMDTRWQTKEGNFTKRLSKLAHKNYALKLPPTLVTRVGNIARDNSQGTEIEIEFTRDLNLPAEEFYHEDSCWWQSYSESRCSLKNNGGIGLRTFGGTRLQPVSGRAWVMPLKSDEEGNLSPTFDATAADAYMVFNGYGDLSGYTPARVVAGMTGMTYRKIPFSCYPMYINGDSGYLVAPEEIAERYATKSTGLVLLVDSHANLWHREASARLVNA